MGVGGGPVCDRTLPGVAFSRTWGLRARSGGRDAEWTLETGSWGSLCHGCEGDLEAILVASLGDESKELPWKPSHNNPLQLELVEVP